LNETPGEYTGNFQPFTNLIHSVAFLGTVLDDSHSNPGRRLFTPGVAVFAVGGEVHRISALEPFSQEIAIFAITHGNFSAILFDDLLARVC
jgi:hypothetical protein